MRDAERELAHVEFGSDAAARAHERALGEARDEAAAEARTAQRKDAELARATTAAGGRERPGRGRGHDPGAAARPRAPRRRPPGRGGGPGREYATTAARAGATKRDAAKWKDDADALRTEAFVEATRLRDETDARTRAREAANRRSSPTVAEGERDELRRSADEQAKRLTAVEGERDEPGGAARTSEAVTARGRAGRSSGGGGRALKEA